MTLKYCVFAGVDQSSVCCV